MNEFWRDRNKTIDEVIQEILQVNYAKMAHLIINNFFLKRIKMSKLEIDNMLNDEIKNIERTDNSPHSSGNIGQIKFTFAIIYKLNGYVNEYDNLLAEADLEVLDKIPLTKRKANKYEVWYNTFGWHKGITRIHIALVTEKYDNIYSIVTRARNVVTERNITSTLWDYCTIEEIMYTIYREIEAEKKYGSMWKDSIELQLKMYRSLYLYLTESENKSEYVKLAMNYIQQFIWSENFSIIDYMDILNLVDTYPEVFGDIIEVPHKIVKANEDLLRFNKVKALTKLTEEEQVKIKKLKKDDLSLFDKKPKNIKKPKEFIEEAIITNHNANVIIKSTKEKISKIALDINSENYIQEFGYLGDAFDTIMLQIKNKVYFDYQFNNYEFFTEYIKEYENNLDKLTKHYCSIESEDVDPKFITLGYRYLDLALIYSLIGEVEKSIYYFEQSIKYLIGELDEEYYEYPRYAEGTSNNFIKNTYAHLRCNVLGEYPIAFFDIGGVYGMDDEELRNIDLFNFPSLSIGDGTINDIIYSAKEMLVVDKAYGRDIESSKELTDILEKIITIDKAKNKEKAKETILKRIEKLYNSIYNFESYIELYPIYMDIKKFVETEV